MGKLLIIIGILALFFFGWLASVKMGSFMSGAATGLKLGLAIPLLVIIGIVIWIVQRGKKR